MKRKIIAILICLIFAIPILANCTMAKDEENPEIIDDSHQIWDLASGFNIISAWFDNDDINLYVSVKMANIVPKYFFATTVLWRYDGVDFYASYQNNNYYYGEDTKSYFPWTRKDTTGIIDLENNIIKITVPLNEIDNPAEGEKLDHTWAMTHWSGFCGLNFHYPLDRAPEWGIYGQDYILI